MCDSAPSVACPRNQHSLSQWFATKITSAPRLQSAQHCAKDKERLVRYTHRGLVSHLLAAAASSGCADQAARGAAPAKPARTATLLPLPELLPRRKPCSAHANSQTLNKHDEL